MFFIGGFFAGIVLQACIHWCISLKSQKKEPTAARTEEESEPLYDRVDDSLPNMNAPPIDGQVPLDSQNLPFTNRQSLFTSEITLSTTSLDGSRFSTSSRSPLIDPWRTALETFMTNPAFFQHHDPQVFRSSTTNPTSRIHLPNLSAPNTPPPVHTTTAELDIYAGLPQPSPDMLASPPGPSSQEAAQTLSQIPEEEENQNQEEQEMAPLVV